MARMGFGNFLQGKYAVRFFANSPREDSVAMENYSSLQGAIEIFRSGTPARAGNCDDSPDIGTLSHRLASVPMFSGSLAETGAES